MSPSISNRISLLLSCVLLSVAPISFAADAIRSERIHFKKGASSAVIEAKIKGYDTVDYLLGARAGQHMQVSLATKHTATYFNILAPGESEEALFNSSMSENQYEGTLQKSGDYKIRVYMIRSAARRNEVAQYRLQVGINGAGDKTVSGASGDALVPGTDFHATGIITCSVTKGQPAGTCKFGVKREGNGTAMVRITRTDGRPRVIFFENGNATGYDQSQAESGRFVAKKEADLNIIQIGDERYEIPDAVVFGG
jgi:hypothetical protein